jgi:uncharacterized integral membrane protein
MKQFRVVLILVFALLVVVFSVQNAEVVPVKLFIWEVETSRVMLILICMAIGSISTILALLPTLLSKRKKDQTNHPTGGSNEEDVAKK